jgi:hypothetical protein
MLNVDARVAAFYVKGLSANAETEEHRVNIGKNN